MPNHSRLTRGIKSMTPTEFIAKLRASDLKERPDSQAH